MKDLQKEINEIKKSHSKLTKEINGRIAVAVATRYYDKENCVAIGCGIQYWTEQMIKQGCSINTDGTKSIFLEKL